MIKRLLALIVLAGAVVAGYLAYTLTASHNPGPKQVFVDIPPGTPTAKIAGMLADAGVIRSEWAFKAARALHPKARLQAGEYGFDRPLSTWDVFNKIARGDIFYHELVIPEGSNIFDVAAAVEDLGFVKSAVFLKVASDPALIRDLDPRAPTLEGYLFPATYRVTRHTTAKQLALQMTGQFRKVWKEAAKPGADVHETTTLASLVEKETAAPAERPTIAAVYVNRLRLGMKLDCDPTTIYAAMLEGRYRGTIYRSNLNSANPYNTYQNVGLPPGPIANPGLASLQAALEPAKADYLYFVAKPGGTGAHNFSRTIAEHNLAVQAYRRGAPK